MCARTLGPLLLFALPLLAHAADDPIPAEKRAAITADLRDRAQKRAGEPYYVEGAKSAAADLKAAEKGRVNPKIKETVPPKTPAGVYTFPSAEAKEAAVKELKQKLARAKNPGYDAAEAPHQIIDELHVFEPGRYGRLMQNTGTVRSVVDGTSVIVTVSQFIPPPNPQVLKLDVLITGVDTSKMSDGVRRAFVGVFYVVGNKKVEGRTLMELVPYKPTTDEQAVIRGEKK
jgi:hypothetical protein